MYALPARTPWLRGWGYAAGVAGLTVATLLTSLAILMSNGPPVTPPPAAIAVVPFSTPGAEQPADGRYGEALAEEVINQLSGVSVLRVFPAEASFAYRDNAYWKFGKNWRSWQSTAMISPTSEARSATPWTVITPGGYS